MTSALSLVHCLKCFRPLLDHGNDAAPPPLTAGVSFIITSCTHAFCSACCPLSAIPEDGQDELVLDECPACATPLPHVAPLRLAAAAAAANSSTTTTSAPTTTNYSISTPSIAPFFSSFTQEIDALKGAHDFQLNLARETCERLRGQHRRQRDMLKRLMPELERAKSLKSRVAELEEQVASLRAQLSDQQQHPSRPGTVAPRQSATYGAAQPQTLSPPVSGTGRPLASTSAVGLATGGPSRITPPGAAAAQSFFATPVGPSPQRREVFYSAPPAPAPAPPTPRPRPPQQLGQQQLGQTDERHFSGGPIRSREPTSMPTPISSSSSLAHVHMQAPPLAPSPRVATPHRSANARITLARPSGIGAGLNCLSSSASLTTTSGMAEQQQQYDGEEGGGGGAGQRAHWTDVAMPPPPTPPRRPLTSAGARQQLDQFRYAPERDVQSYRQAFQPRRAG